MNSNDIMQPHSNSNVRPLRSYSNTNSDTNNSNSNSYIQQYGALNIALQPFMYNYGPGLLLNTVGAGSGGSSTGYSLLGSAQHSNVHSVHSDNVQELLSPNIDTVGDTRPLYRIAPWQDIAEFWEGTTTSSTGAEERPRCGRLSNGLYFTQRAAASSEVYMLFEHKSDYINNFVNYYFSDKNLARDQKLVALMDPRGVIALSALVQFPKLHQVGCTVEDLVQAFQTNTVVVLVDLVAGSGTVEKGAQRRDKWAPRLLLNKVDSFSEKSIMDVDNGGAVEKHVEQQPQPQQQFIYFPQIIPQHIYANQSAMMQNTAAAYQPYTFLPLSNPPQHQQSHAALFWPMTQHDSSSSSSPYGNQSLLQQMSVNNRYNTSNNSELPQNRLN